jgi:hypothetical protein
MSTTGAGKLHRALFFGTRPTSFVEFFRHALSSQGLMSLSLLKCGYHLIQQIRITQGPSKSVSSRHLQVCATRLIITLVEQLMTFVIDRG